MSSLLFSSIVLKVGTALSPQETWREGDGHPGRYAWGPSLRSLIVALAAELEASEARVRFAEARLADHGRHCICNAAMVAAEEREAAHLSREHVEPCDPHANMTGFEPLNRAA